MGLSFDELHAQVGCRRHDLRAVLGEEVRAGRLVVRSRRYELNPEAFPAGTLDALRELSLDGDRSRFAGGRRARQVGQEANAIRELSERWGRVAEEDSGAARAGPIVRPRRS